MDALPRARELDLASYRLHAVAFPLWTFTLVAGAIWAENAWGRYWGWDPKEVWTFVIWVVYAGYLHARATRGWQGRKAATLALVGYGCILFQWTQALVLRPISAYTPIVGFDAPALQASLRKRKQFAAGRLACALFEGHRNSFNHFPSIRGCHFSSSKRRETFLGG